MIAQEKPDNKIHIKKAGKHRMFLAAHPSTQADPQHAAIQAYEQIADELNAQGMEIVQERLFCNLAILADIRSARRKIFQNKGIHPPLERSQYQGGIVLPYRPIWALTLDAQRGRIGIRTSLVRVGIPWPYA